MPYFCLSRAKRSPEPYEALEPAHKYTCTTPRTRARCCVPSHHAEIVIKKELLAAHDEVRFDLGNCSENIARDGRVGPVRGAVPAPQAPENRSGMQKANKLLTDFGTVQGQHTVRAM